MTETSAPQSPEQPVREDQPPGWNTDNLRDYRRLRRSRSDRKIAGVAGGLGRHLDVDPTVLRVLFVVLAFFGGAGLLLYGVIWLLVPDDESGAVVRTSDGTRNAIIMGALVLAGLRAVGDGVEGYGFPWPRALMGLVVAAVLMSRDSRRRGTAPPPPPDATAVLP